MYLTILEKRRRLSIFDAPCRGNRVGRALCNDATGSFLILLSIAYGCFDGWQLALVDVFPNGQLNFLGKRRQRLDIVIGQLKCECHAL